MKVAVPIAKNILTPLGIKAAASAIGVAIQKKTHGSNEEMNDIMKFVPALEDFNILLKGITKTIENETYKKGEFLGMALATLKASY